ncbi:UDP-4-amino-4-deoxy-L-arabinose-oxoglutarate aminotransferase protein [Rhizobium phage RHph_TM16]|nr:UDP-4-amino-4-deoxy-L-arabinose-oxoglutarate aminotransferase protein [Rhizobium phage RHph_TM16]
MLSITANHAAIHEDWQRVLDSGVFTEGPFVRLLEDEVSTLYGTEAIAFNSAGTALFAVYRALNLPNKAALVPVNTFFATGAMAKEARMSTILVDADKQNFCLDLDATEKMLESKTVQAMTRALVYTPVGGGFDQKHYIDAAMMADDYHLKFVTDGAHALGVGKGTLGKFGPAVFSLYPTKAVPGGEGGIVVTDNPDLAGFLRDFRNYGKFKDPLSDTPNVIQYAEGFNFRMDEWTAVVALHQLRALNQIMEQRSAVADKLAQIVEPMVTWDETNWYRYIVDTEFPAKRTVGKVYARTDQLDVAMGLRRNEADDSRFPNAIEIANGHQCLPLHEKMSTWSKAQIERYILGLDRDEG